MFPLFPCPPHPFPLPCSKHETEGVLQLSVVTAMKTGPNDMILAVVWAYSVCFLKIIFFFITNNFILHLVLPCQEPPSPHPFLTRNARWRGVSTLSLAHHTSSTSLTWNTRRRGFSYSQLRQQQKLARQWGNRAQLWCATTTTPSLTWNMWWRGVSTLSLAHHTPFPSLARNVRWRGFSNSQLWWQWKLARQWGNRAQTMARPSFWS